MKKLLLCSGPRQSPYGQDGWFRVDSDAGSEPDLVATVPPIPDAVKAMGPWDMVALIHGIEHFEWWDAVELLKDINGILAPEGNLILEQPNLETCLGHLDDPAYLGGIYGDVTRKEPAMRHRFGYTPNLLGAFLTRAGFSQVHVERAVFHRPERDFRMVAVR